MKIGLALGGGGARGLGHLPVIFAMEELGLKIDEVAGSSIGSLVGVGLSHGMSAADVKEYFLECFAKSGDTFAKLWALKPTSWKDFWNRGVKLSQFDIELILEAFLPDYLPRHFDALALPFSVTTADINTAELHVIRKGDLRAALAASCAIPGLFKPVQFEGRVLIDGGVCNPVPFDCFDATVDIAIGVDVLGFPVAHSPDTKLSTFECMIASSLISQQTLIAAKMALAKPDLLLRPPIEGIHLLDFLKTRQILEQVMPFKDHAKTMIAAIIEKKLQ
ncbi:patatin-like phospholipase family protein [Bartonella tamiae]|uniref:PNPLA domain-containing protein n=1 Tax=Bartonella tamiae Th239 TaxID=1094558 RepID=J1K165_9HYPH|nr:patatin-like phospholipase family protein [Bartonella tamiae]EJF90795.1 hypothetical protein ME5_00631 [Bartonella tamiae Th239]EJF93420.1 hypothetical protein MEG_01251 [Bartonella tamiae Th307]